MTYLIGGWRFGLLPDSGLEDTFLKWLEGWDLPAAKSAVSGLVKALGFGPEAEGIAVFLIGFFVVLVIIGYAAGPKNSDKDVPKDAKDKK